MAARGPREPLRDAVWLDEREGAGRIRAHAAFREHSWRRWLVARFGALPFLPLPTPDRHDHLEAVQLRNRARRRGVEVGTIEGSEPARAPVPSRTPERRSDRGW